MTLSFRTTLAALTLACLAAPALAQSPAGPRASTLAAAQLPPATLHPLPDPARELGAKVPASEPHLYYSIPLSAALAVAGAAVGYGVGFVGLDCSDESSACTHGPDNGEYLTAYLGMAAGAATGAHLGGLRHDSKGSFLATLGGAAAGALPLLFSDKESDNAVSTATFVSLGTSTAGAVLVDYLIRRPRR